MKLIDYEKQVVNGWNHKMTYSTDDEKKLNNCIRKPRWKLQDNFRNRIIVS